MSRLIRKNKKQKKIFFKQEGGSLKQQRVAENQRHSTLAKHYVQHPTLPNLVKAGYHWFKSKPGLGGQQENDYVYQTGTAPIPEFPGLPALKAAKKISTASKYVHTSGTVSKTIKNAEAMEKGIVQTASKKLTKNNLKYNQEIQNLRQYPAFENQYNKIARKLFMSNDAIKNKGYLKQIEDLLTSFKKGI